MLCTQHFLTICQDVQIRSEILVIHGYPSSVYTRCPAISRPTSSSAEYQAIFRAISHDNNWESSIFRLWVYEREGISRVVVKKSIEWKTNLGI